MIDEWQPTEPETDIDITLLVRTGVQTSITDVSQIPHLEPSIQLQLASYIKYDEARWQLVLSEMDNSVLVALAFFYTRAEEKWATFTAGSNNPAIWIFRYLKRQKLLPSKLIIRQLKSETKNRYIPYGSVL